MSSFLTAYLVHLVFLWIRAVTTRWREWNRKWRIWF